MEVTKYLLIYVLVPLCSCVIIKQDKTPSILKSRQIVGGGVGSKTQCEYYNATCFDHGGDSNSCQGVEICETWNHVCFVVWNNNNSNSTQHKSGRNVKLMGCIEPNR